MDHKIAITSGATLGLLCCACLAVAGCSNKGGAADAGARPDLAPVFRGSGIMPDEIPLTISLKCPGDPICPDTSTSADGGANQSLPALEVGFAFREITPTVEPFEDLNGNGRWDAGEPYTDENGNGKFDPVWMTVSAHEAYGVHDPSWVRCYVLRQGETTLAHCVFDVIGYFYSDLQQLRADVPPSLGIDYLMSSATHDHSNEDTLGLYGPDDTITGYNPDWMKYLRGQAVAALTEAVGNLKAAKMSLASIPVEDGPNHDMHHYIADGRDPLIIDNVMHVMQFDGADDGVPIVTIVNWTAHPDAMSRGNRYLSSEWPHYLRRFVSQHTGSEVVYISGAVGGQIGPGGGNPASVAVEAIGSDGKMYPKGDFAFAEAWGESIGSFANKAFDARVPVDAPKLAFRVSKVNVHIENPLYIVGFFTHVLPRVVFGYDKSKPLVNDASGDNTPLIDTEFAYLTLGPVAISTAPGELHPESFIGGYDGSKTGTELPFIHTGPIVGDSCNCDYPAPPDVSIAPKAPYLIDLMDGDAQHRMVFGLTLDMLGYFVPRFEYYLDPVAPYYVEPPGDSHYEETNSIGPRCEPEILGTMRQLAISSSGKSPF